MSINNIFNAQYQFILMFSLLILYLLIIMAFNHVTSRIMRATYRFMATFVALFSAIVFLLGITVLRWYSDLTICLSSLAFAMIVSFEYAFYRQPLTNDLPDHKLDEALDQAIDDLDIKPIDTVTDSQINDYLITRLEACLINNDNLVDTLTMQIKELLTNQIKHGNYQLQNDKLILQIDTKNTFLKCCEPHLLYADKHFEKHTYNMVNIDDIFQGAIYLINQLQADNQQDKAVLIARIMQRYRNVTPTLQAILQRIANHFEPNKLTTAITDKICLCTYPDRNYWLVGLTNISYRDFFDDFVGTNYQYNGYYQLTAILDKVNEDIQHQIFNSTNNVEQGTLKIEMSALKVGD